jgi:hypothetical protein
MEFDGAKWLAQMSQVNRDENLKRMASRVLSAGNLGCELYASDKSQVTQVIEAKGHGLFRSCVAATC